MSLRPLIVVLLVGGVAVAGCGGPSAGKSVQSPATKIIPPSKRPPAPPPVRDVTITPDQTNAALAEQAAALKSSDGLIRAHANEAISRSEPAPFEPQLIAAIDDVAPVARVSAAMAVGELRLVDARPALLKHTNDSDDLVRVAVRFALHRLGDRRLSHELELFSRSDNASVRGMTVMALGLLEEPSAVKILLPMQADRSATVRLQVSDALWRLGNQQGLANLAASAVSAYPDDQMIAFLALAEPRDTRVIEHVRAGLVADYEETRLVAARAVGMLGSDEGYTIAANGLESVDARKRMLGALALGAIGRKDAIDLLMPLLKDNDADVRVAAAAGILQIAKK
jgi:HEAT repeat protein